MRARQAAVFFFFLLALGLHAVGQVRLSDLAIQVKGASREFAYTNKNAALLYGETNGEHRSSWQGFSVYGHKMLDSYTLILDGDTLLPGSADCCTVFPDHLERTYPGGISEEVRPVDSLDLFAVIIRSPRPAVVSVIPWFTDVRQKEQVTVELQDQLAAIARNAHLSTKNADPAPRWLTVYGPGFTPRLQESRARNRYSPVLLSSGLGRDHLLLFSAGLTVQVAAAQAREAQPEDRFVERQRRMERLLSASPSVSGNRRFNLALAWAKLSLDALIMHQGTKGIFAGLPWFNNYWGRDTFIALPGAALVTGRLEDAREILRSFAEFQERDSLSNNFGRIPNFVNPTDRAYNTADGTPRFVCMAREYIERSADRRFLFELYPVVVRSIEGTLRYHADSLGFLTHGDAESWMDASGPEGPWSPRGNRANDVQALWAAQLDAGVWFATEVSDVRGARAWTSVLKKLRANFPRYFEREGSVADRLRSDGTADWSVRPNQIFCGPILRDGPRSRTLFSVVSRLTFPYGVASLSQDDERFHPYHYNPPYYPKDAAYHNGTVWTWLQGTVISELSRFGREDLAWTLTSNAVHQILDRGAVGTQSELLDALPRPGTSEPALSGTFSQAWNLAEFVRNWYDDYLGLSINLLSRKITLSPHVPDSLGNVEATLPVGSGSLTVSVTGDRASREVAIRTENLGTPLEADIRFRTGSDSIVSTEIHLPETGFSAVTFQGSSATAIVKHSRVALSTSRTSAPRIPQRYGRLTLATPHLREGLLALQGPGHPMLSNRSIKTSNQSARTLVDAQDPEGDDVGILPGGPYSYPLNPVFVEGSFDLTRFIVRYDSSAIYFLLRFRGLSNPGWHPEYGFQLTYCAIAIDTDGVPGSGARIIPSNANVSLSADRAFERLILIGGGVRVEDDTGMALVEYFPLPEDKDHPLGDSAGGTIEFAIPRVYLGRPDPRWRFTVLVGAQDDHGGAGLGEFRAVNRERGDWNGGGRMRPVDPNVYDQLEIQGLR
jgi:glycogen debranching enzyme